MISSIEDCGVCVGVVRVFVCVRVVCVFGCVCVVACVWCVCNMFLCL